MTPLRQQLFPLLLLALPFFAPAQEEVSQAQLDKINAAISATEKQLAGTQKEKSELELLLSTLEQEIAALNTAVIQLDQGIADEQQRQQELQNQAAELEQEKAQQQALIARYIRSAYQNGRQEYLKLLFNQQRLDQSARALKYYDYFNQARRKKVSAYKQTLDQLNKTELALSESTALLQRQRQDRSQQLQTLQAGRRSRQEILQALNQELASGGKELQRLLDQRREMEILLEELTRSIANLSLGGQQVAFAELKGQLPWPLQGRLLNSFGAKHPLGDLDWQGVTLSAAEGEEVIAIHHGRVVFADWFSNSGLLLIIDHGDGYMSLYAHNQLLYKELGEWVDSGELIAAAGNSGGQKQSGVYFEIRHKGRSVDPVSWCQPRN